MTPPFQNAVLPESIGPTRPWKDRRVIVAGSVGLSLLVIVALAVSGRSGTDASAATPTTAPRTAKETPQNTGPPSMETYPIPPEALLAGGAAPTTATQPRIAVAVASTHGGIDAGKPGNQHPKQGRDRLGARKVVSPAHFPGTTNRGPGAGSANARPTSPVGSAGGFAASAGRRATEPATPGDSLPAEPRKRVPLVEDQPSVHILD